MADDDWEAALHYRALLPPLPQDAAPRPVAHAVQPEAGGWFVVEHPETREREVAYCARVRHGLVWTLMGHYELLPLYSRTARKRVTLTD